MKNQILWGSPKSRLVSIMEKTVGSYVEKLLQFRNYLIKKYFSSYSSQEIEEYVTIRYFLPLLFSEQKKKWHTIESCYWKETLAYSIQQKFSKKKIYLRIKHINNIQDIEEELLARYTRSY